MEFLQDLFALVGRLLISLTFFWAAYEKITHWNQTMDYMKSRHIPQPKIALPVSVALQVIGSIFVFLGWFAHLGALLLLIVAVPVLIYTHLWWKKDGSNREMEKLYFLKDAAIIGGLFMVLAYGSGHWGV